jgi:hypothetical protein
MANLRKFCACGDQLVAHNLTRQQREEMLEIWNGQHDRPGCYATNSASASFARAKKTIEDVTREDGE